MGSPPGQHLEDTCVALVSSPPPRRPLQSSHQAGSAPQQHVVEVGDPLLEAGPGVGPLGPRHPFPPLTCPFCPTLLIPPGWAQQGPFLWEASWASPQKRPVSSSGILRSFTRFSVKTLVFCSVFLGACLASERSCVCPAWASSRPALWLAHSRCSGGNSHLPTQPPVLPRPRPPQHQQLRGGCLGLRKPRKGAPLLPAPSGAGDLQSRCRALGFS